MNTLTKKSSEQNMKNKKSKDNSGSGKIRRVLSKISGAFMLPIAVMAIAGLLLGVGSIIIGQYQEAIDRAIREQDQSSIDSIPYWTNIVTLGEFIRALGQPVFIALPLIFAAAFVIAFTDEAGVAVFAVIIAYVAFISLQAVFITPVTEDVPNTIATPAVPEVKDAAGNITSPGVPAVPVKTTVGYQIIFTQGGRDPKRLFRLVTNNFGIRSLDTSVFGGIVIGLIVQKLYNRFHTVQFPSVISFFGGKRFVAIISTIIMIPTSLLFLLLWPWIGIGLNVFGTALAGVPYGFESFVFGFIERSLVPFGLHHVFYAPLWYTPVGGDLNEAINTFNQSVGTQPGFEGSEALKDFFLTVQKNPSLYQGDSLISINVPGIKHDRVAYSIATDTAIETRDYSLYGFIANELGIKVGRFLNGKYSFMILGLPAAGMAMIFAAPKENRKVAVGAVVPAIFTCMIAGVTEPIEFTFLFLAPWLFWGFHAFMCALSFMLANLLEVHSGSAFSGGMLDLIIYGISPFKKGTQFWWSFVVGAGYVPIYYLVFYFAIKRFNLETPGRGSNTKLFLKSDYLNKKSKKLVAAGVGVVEEEYTETTVEEEIQIDPKALAVVQAYGGLSNITAFNNCASRLRYDVVDSDLVDADALKATGAAGVKIEGKTHAQAIYGPIAEQLNSKIKSLRGDIARWEAKQALLAQEAKQGKDPETLVLDKSVDETEIIKSKSLEELETERQNYQKEKRAFADYEALLLANKLNAFEQVAKEQGQDPIDQLEQEVSQEKPEDAPTILPLHLFEEPEEVQEQTYETKDEVLDELFEEEVVEEIVEEKTTIEDKFDYDQELARQRYQNEKRYLADLEADRMAALLAKEQLETKQEEPVEEVVEEQPTTEYEFDYEGAELSRQRYQNEKRYLADLEAARIADLLAKEQLEKVVEKQQPEEQVVEQPSSEELDKLEAFRLASELATATKTEIKQDKILKPQEPIDTTEIFTVDEYLNKLEQLELQRPQETEEVVEEVIEEPVEEVVEVVEEEPEEDTTQLLTIDEYLEKITMSEKHQIEEEPFAEPVILDEEEEDTEIITEEDGTQKTRIKDQIVFAPAIGKIRSLKSLRDGVFSEQTKGEGFAVRFSAEKVGRIYAPFDSKVIHVSAEKHVYIIKSRKGVEATLQIGIGTEVLEGKGFKSMVSVDQQVKTGDLIATFDLSLIKKAKIRNDLIFIVSPSSRRTQVTITKEEKNITRVESEIAKVSHTSE